VSQYFFSDEYETTGLNCLGVKPRGTRPVSPVELHYSNGYWCSGRYHRCPVIAFEELTDIRERIGVS